MKNNILLIFAVTVISVGIIVATVLISGAGNADDDRSQTSSLTTSSATASTQHVVSEEPPQTIVTTEERTSTSITDTAPEESAEHPFEHDTSHGIVATAQSLIGMDFVDGGQSADVGFDNSGFIYYVLRENGYIACPRGVYEQSQMGGVVEYDNLKAGNLVFFYDEDLATVSFGGIYVGDGIMIACLMPGTQVKEINISTPYYKTHFYRGVTLI